ncbi:MAG: molybdenum cofactor cytidylyltransferase [Proteobacteria bacterium]|nr:molybdenum cofactor cytidylyltransferase [Pseudomonadota bacterium]
MVSGIILASGFSKRMKKEKLLLPLSGIPMVEYIIRAAKASHLDEVILIYRNTGIKDIGIKYLDKIVYNDHADQGQSAAVKLGVSASHKETDAYMFLVGDQPFLRETIINILIDNFKKTPSNIVVPVYNGKKGSPVIFPARYKQELLALSGDTGGRIIIEEHKKKLNLVEIENTEAGIDIDTQNEYEKIIR